MNIILFNLHNYPVMELRFKTLKLCKLSKVTHMSGGEARI